MAATEEIYVPLSRIWRWCLAQKSEAASWEKQHFQPHTEDLPATTNCSSVDFFAAYLDPWCFPQYSLNFPEPVLARRKPELYGVDDSSNTCLGLFTHLVLTLFQLSAKQERCAFPGCVKMRRHLRWCYQIVQAIAKYPPSLPSIVSRVQKWYNPESWERKKKKKF